MKREMPLRGSCIPPQIGMRSSRQNARTHASLTGRDALREFSSGTTMQLPSAPKRDESVLVPWEHTTKRPSLSTVKSVADTQNFCVT